MIRFRLRHLAPLACFALSLGHASAQELAPPENITDLRPAAGIEMFASADAEKTDVVKVMGRALLNFSGRDKFQGIAVEKAWFTPLGQKTKEEERVYLDLADTISDKWLWQARVGTDGHTVLGSASVRSADWKQSYFVEREIIETPQGLQKGIYYTFLGANFDLPLDDRNVVSSMVGVQKFSGKNERLHLRGSYIHVIKPEWGLSAQLRARYFHSTTPNEFDYFSPRDYVQVLPVLQLRKFDNAGWMYQIAGGYGMQHATGTKWDDARFASLRVESPVRARKLNAFFEVQYTNNSISGGLNYDYVMGRLGVTVGF
jgi:hypothetical protein